MQKTGRCVRLVTELGEVVVIVSSNAMRRYEALCSGGKDLEVQPPPDPSSGQVDVQAEGVRSETTDTVPAVMRRGGKGQLKYHGELAERDLLHLAQFIATKGCRRIPWDNFFENDKKCMHLIPQFYVLCSTFQYRPSALSTHAPSRCTVLR